MARELGGGPDIPRHSRGSIRDTPGGEMSDRDSERELGKYHSTSEAATKSVVSADSHSKTVTREAGKENDEKSAGTTHSGEKSDPRTKPFTMILAGHGNADVENIAILSGRVKALLDSHETGKAVILLEAANGTEAATEVVRRSIASGKLLSEARHDADDLFLETNDYTHEEYNDARTDTIDTLLQDPSYSGRIDVVVEGHVPEDVSAFEDAFADHRPFFDYVPADHTWEDAVHEAEERAQRNAGFHTMRDARITSQIKDVLAEEDVIGGVGIFGAYHTAITHNLNRDGYSVRRIFPEAENGVFTFDIYDEYARRLRMHPDKTGGEGEINILVTSDIIDRYSPSKDTASPQEKRIRRNKKYRDLKKTLMEITETE